MRDDVQSLKDAIPKALNAQKDLTDSRLREVNTELKSLKTLISQRVNPGPSSAVGSAAGGGGGYLRPSGGSTTPTTAATSSAATGNENGEAEEKTTTTTTTTTTADSVPRDVPSYVPSTSRSPVNGTSTKASIPAWQMAMANKNTATSNGSDAGGSGAGSSS